MRVPTAYGSVESYTMSLSTFLSSELVTLLTAQLHHLDILPRPNRTGHGYDPGDWSRLPAEWQVWFDSAESADDLQVKLDDIRLGIDLPGRPTSLSTFLEATRALPLPRDVAHPGPTNTNVRPSGMSVKKAHEVAHFIDLVSRIARERGVRRIIDIGAGQGYLTRTLAALHPTFSFLAVDGSEAQLAGSQRLSPELAHQITYLPAFIHSAVSARLEIETWLGDEDALIIGLHCCGCLTDDILGMFIQTKHIKGAVVAACCYHHLRLSSTDDQATAFPSSERIKKGGVRLSSTGLMAACQDTSNWASGARDTAALAGRRLLVRKKMHYRRLLTVLLTAPDMPATPEPLPLGAVHLAQTDNFATYAARALSKIGVFDKVDRESILAMARALEESFGDWRWEGRGRVVEALAKACGGVVESAIALDRFWALNEAGGVEADVVVGWAYDVSPRNLVVVAGKGCL